MTISTLATFFMWCTILNGAVLMFSCIFYLCAKDWICRMHCRIFGISQETVYGLADLFTALYKMVFITFNLVPYVALIIMK
jgi:hypothetical protein